MFARALRERAVFCSQQSHLVTRETPSIVIVFHPVSSQIAQVTRHGTSDRALRITRCEPHAQKLHGRMTELCGAVPPNK
jgi:hypothetical protein